MDTNDYLLLRFLHTCSFFFSMSLYSFFYFPPPPPPTIGVSFSLCLYIQSFISLPRPLPYEDVTIKPNFKKTINSRKSVPGDHTSMAIKISELSLNFSVTPVVQKYKWADKAKLLKGYQDQKA